jgi:predicted nucleic acid-binding protein
MKITENQKNRLVKAVSKQYSLSESVVGNIMKLILSKRLMKDTDIKNLANELDRVTKTAKVKLDSMEKSGELKRTPELIALRKSLGID